MSETRIGLTHDTPQASSLLLVGTLALVWGCNWPVMKLGVTEIAPLTFRASTIAFAGIGLLLASRLSGESLRIPRRMWSKVIIMGLFNIGGWNALILFGVQQLPAGRSAILAFTMPVWAVLLSKALLHEPLSRRKLIGMLFGMAGMALLLGEDIRHVQRAPAGALLILAAAASWAFGTVLLRRWKLALPQNTLTGWMMVIGWVPIVLVAPLLDPHALASLAAMSSVGWFAVLYNIFLAGTLAHWAWFRMARTLPVAVSSLSSLPVPVVGVLSGMVILGERPGAAELVALGLVLVALVAVLSAPKGSAETVTPME